MLLVSARRFRDLSGDTGEEIPVVEVVERAPRQIQTPELAVLAAVTANGVSLGE